jgi:hypothetical protein
MPRFAMAAISVLVVLYFAAGSINSNSPDSIATRESSVEIATRESCVEGQKKTTQYKPSGLWGAMTNMSLNSKVLLHLKGEPKSGTTWTEVIVYEMGRQLCEIEIGEKGKRVHPCNVIQFDPINKRVMELLLGPQNNSGLLFDINDKHMIPDLVLSEECNHPHPSKIAKDGPCNQAFGGPDEYGMPSVTNLEQCVRDCRGTNNKKSMKKLPCEVSSKEETSLDVHMHIHRDPRDVVVSECFHLNRSKSLEACVLKKYPIVALWTKFRELWWFPSEPDDYSLAPCAFHISYSDMVNCPLVEYRRIAQAILGSKDTDIIHDDLLRLIIAKTSPSALKNGTQYDMHDFKNAPKVRSAGEKNYTHYNMSLATVTWMDEVYEDLHFHAFLKSPIPWGDTDVPGCH